VTLRRPSCLLVGQTRLSWRSAGDSSDQKIVTAEELYEDFTPKLQVSSSCVVFFVAVSAAGQYFVLCFLHADRKSII